MAGVIKFRDKMCVIVFIFFQFASAAEFGNSTIKGNYSVEKLQSYNENTTLDGSTKSENTVLDNTEIEFWNHTAMKVLRCGRNFTFPLPYPQTEDLDCQKLRQHHAIGGRQYIEFGWSYIAKVSRCSWVACSSPPYHVRLVLIPSSRKQWRSEESGITVCVGCTILENGTLDGRKYYYSGNQLQMFSHEESILLISQFKPRPSSYNTFTAIFEILQYDPSCDKNYDRDQTGTITSPGYPKYGLVHEFFCRYRIRVAANQMIKFTVNYLNLTAEKSKFWENIWIVVRDGLDSLFPILYTISDERPPSKSFFSQHNAVEVSLYGMTGSNVSSAGYDIAWTSVSRQNITNVHNGNGDTANEVDLQMDNGSVCTRFMEIEKAVTSAGPNCGGIIVGKDEFIELDYPYEYPANLSCLWAFCGNMKNPYVRLSIFQIENEETVDCERQYLEVCVECTLSDTKRHFDGKSKHKNCGYSLYNVHPFQIFSGKDIMMQFFRRDVVYDFGFRAHVQFLPYDPDIVCQKEYLQTSGIIESPGYPYNYQNFVQCNWEITVPTGDNITFTVIEFEMPEQNYPYVENVIETLYFRDGIASQLPVVKAFTNRTPPPSTFYSFSNQVAFQLLGYHAQGIKRFKLMWNATDLGCNGTLRLFSGVIRSPGYPRFIKSETFCTWNITVNLGHSIHITFSDVNIGHSATYLETSRKCTDNYIQITDRIREDDFQPDQVCDTTRISTYTSKSNSITIVLKTSKSILNQRGIQLNFVTVCKQTLNELEGVIESINYSDAYQYGLSCVWDIIGYPNATIVLNITDLRVLETFNPSNTSSSYNLTEFAFKVFACDQHCIKYKNDINGPTVVEIDSKFARIEFNTFNSPWNVIFRLHWKIDGCVYHLNTSSGSFTSKKFPRRYANYETCKWKIITQPGSKVKLTIHYWNIERSSNCKFDALTVHGGPSDNSQPLAILCGEIGQQIFEPVFISPYNTMLVTFISDKSVTGFGFNASFIQADGGSCHMTTSSPYGFVYSVGFPNHYKIHQYCISAFRVNPSFRAAVQFEHYDIGFYCTESIQVYDDKYTWEHTFCGNNKPGNRTLTSPDNTIIINFQSNEMTDPYSGFKAVYFQNCGATLTNDFGIFATPDYMTLLRLPVGLPCTWTVKAPTKKHRVAIIFTELDWSVAIEDCANYSIRIFDGNVSEEATAFDTANVPTYYDRCCGPPPGPFVSNGSVVTLEARGLIDIQFSAFYMVLAPDCLRQLQTYYSDDGENPDKCKKIITYSKYQDLHVTFRNFSHLVIDKNSITNNVTCEWSYVVIYKDDFGGIPVETICRKTAAKDNFIGVFRGKYWIVYLKESKSVQTIQGIVNQNILENIPNLFVNATLNNGYRFNANMYRL